MMLVIVTRIAMAIISGGDAGCDDEVDVDDGGGVVGDVGDQGGDSGDNDGCW